MLASDKIANAFIAICEEAEKLKKEDNSAAAQSGLQTIISIAKHQSDIRDAKGGSCKSHKSC
jgi:hypothetical protein